VQAKTLFYVSKMCAFAKNLCVLQKCVSEKILRADKFLECAKKFEIYKKQTKNGIKSHSQIFSKINCKNYL
jgi:hypothetical protein